jgi:hypothetical protein
MQIGPDPRRDNQPPWHLLAQALQKPDRAWLTDERIPDDWALENLLEQDLMRGPESSHERCARAAQLEVIADEVPAPIVAAHAESPPAWSSFDPTRP